mmetsp:Transcript_62702/g.139603  ORF Transcript_62702/g.139603 Transcript_62702/m.139603 type:complete len:270 (+) Transcript_62702:312-1121(+)
MQIREELAQWLKIGQQLRFPGRNVFGPDDVVGFVHAHPLQLLVHTVHRLEQLRLPKLDLGNTRGLQDASSGILGGVHLHEPRVDRGVDNNPRTSTDLAVRWDVDNDWLLKLCQLVHNERTEFQYLLKHILAAAGESPPVGEQEERKALALVEILDGLCSLVRRVREPHLPRLGRLLRLRLEVGRVSQDGLVTRAVLGDDDANGHPSQPPPADHNGFGPISESLHERALIQKARDPLALLVGSAEQIARVVRGAGGGIHLHRPIHRVDHR